MKRTGIVTTDTGARIEWDGVVCNQASSPLVTCPACGGTRRVSYVVARRIETGRQTGKCGMCAKNRPRGGRVPIKGGYIGLLTNGLPPSDALLAAGMGQYAKQYVPEHRLVMARHLGRSLLRGEYVHHLNGIKDDNRLENLEVVTRNSHGAAEKVLVDRLRAEIARLQGLLDEHKVAYAPLAFQYDLHVG